MKRDLLKSYSIVTLLPAVILALVCTRFFTEDVIRTCVSFTLQYMFIGSYRMVTSISDGLRGLLFIGVFFGAQRISKRHPIPFFCSVLCGALALIFPCYMTVDKNLDFGEHPFELINGELTAHSEDDVSAFTVIPANVTMSAQFSCRLEIPEEDVRTILTASDIADAQVLEHASGTGYAVRMDLTPKATRRLYGISRKYYVLHSCLRFYFDEIFIVEAPILAPFFSESIRFPGKFSEEDAVKIVEMLLKRK